MGAATNLLRAVLRQAGPHVLEATLGPTACFLTGRALWGIDGALALALGWTGACMAVRAVRGRRMSGLLLIGATTLVLRTIVAMSLHSERAYLMAPALVTIAMGIVFVASAGTKKPLLQRVIGDLVPRRWLDTADPRTARLCRVASVVWGVEQIIVALVSLAMILSLSATTYVVLHELISWLIAITVIGSILPFFWADIRSLARSARPTPAHPAKPAVLTAHSAR